MSRVRRLPASDRTSSRERQAGRLRDRAERKRAQAGQRFVEDPAVDALGMLGVPSEVRQAPR
jgi:hypothetical protein